jgi:xylitol oxidase
MSPAYQRDSVAIHFTWHPNTPAVLALLPKLEAALAPFDARPHWGKLHHANPARHYAKFADFRGLAHRLDLTGKFRNPYLDRLLDENAV